MLQTIEAVNTVINNFICGIPAIICIIGVGLYLSIRTGFTSTYGNWGSIFTAVAMCCFAFSTIIGWGLYGD